MNRELRTECVTMILSARLVDVTAARMSAHSVAGMIALSFKQILRCTAVPGLFRFPGFFGMRALRSRLVDVTAARMSAHSVAGMIALSFKQILRCTAVPGLFRFPGFFGMRAR